MNLNQIIAEARVHAQEPSQKRFTDAEVLTYINVCYREIMSEAKQRRVARLDILESHGQYIFLLPERLLELETVVLVKQDGTRGNRIMPKIYREFIEHIGNREYFDSSPNYYTITGNTIRFDGVIDASVDSHLEFSIFDVPEDLSAENYIPEFSSAFHHILSYGASAHMYLADKEPDLYRVWWDRFQKGKQDILLSIRRQAEDGYKIRDNRGGNPSRREYSGTASYS